MPESPPHITAAELRILKVLWRLGAGTVRQVLEALPPRGKRPPAYTTVMTLMKQLADKGVLAVDRQREPYIYTPKVRREHVLRDRLSRFLHNVFDGRAEDLVLRLVEDADLTPDDLRRIEAKIRRREQADRRGRVTPPALGEGPP